MVKFHWYRDKKMMNREDFTLMKYDRLLRNQWKLEKMDEQKL